MLLCRNVFLVLRRFQSSTTYFSMENFLAPREIRGMKTLKKEKFENVVKVPCIVVNLNNLKDILKHIKPNLLKLIACHPVRVRDDSRKEILLNPSTVSSYEDLNLKAREVLNNLEEEVHFEHVDVKLTYDNFKASDILRAVLPEELGSVSGYSIIGHIVHLNLKSEFLEYKNIIGQVLLDKIPRAKTVVNKVDTIDSKFRTFHLEILAGIDDFLVEVAENRCIYKFDFSKVYWNPRLCTEHQRVVDNLKAGDYLYDAFAGVGPFTIPAAKKGCTVLANDLNCEAVEYLKENLRLNKIKKSVVTSVKDAGNFIKEDFKTHFAQLKPGNYNVHITMNLPALAPTFLPNFKGLFNENDCEKLKTLPIPEAYVYCFTKGESDPISAAKMLISNNLSIENLQEEIKSVSFVRKVAPDKEMMRVVLALTPKILVSQKRSASPIIESDNKKFNAEFLSQEEEKEKLKTENDPGNKEK